VADHEQGLASGILQTSFQVGGAIVLAVVTAVIDARGAGRVISAHTLTAYRPALGLIAGVAIAGAAVALTGLRSPRRHPDAAVAAGERGRAELEPARR
jgi:hypothetical protein